MAADTFDIDIEQWTSFRMSLVYSDDQGPVPIDNYEARMQIRRRFGSPLLIDASSTNEMIDIQRGGQPGRIDVWIGAEQTAVLTRNCVYDLNLIRKDLPDDVIRVVQGKVVVRRAVTEPYSTEEDLAPTQPDDTAADVVVVTP